MCVDKKRQWSQVAQRLAQLRDPLDALHARRPGRGREAPVQARSRGCLSAIVVVVGSGPNGLAAAIALAQAGRSVTVLEGAETVGGGCRSEELTLPGFVHDICSTVHALALASPFLRSLPLARARARAGASRRCRSRTRSTTARRSCSSAPWTRRPRRLGARTREAYRRLFDAARRATPTSSCREILGPLRPPRHPLALARFGLRRRSARRRGSRARASRASARARCSPAAARTRCCRSTQPGQRGLRARARCSAAHARRLARRPRRLAATRRRARVAPALARRRDRDRHDGWSRSTSSPAPAPMLLDVTPRQLLRLAGHRLPGRLPPRGSRATATGRASSSSTGRSTARSPGAAPECRARGHGAPRRHARRDRRLGARPRRGRRASRAPVRAARAAEPVRPDAARRRASTPPGPTATCRTARRAT